MPAKYASGTSTPSLDEMRESAEMYEVFARMFVTVPDADYLAGIARALASAGHPIDPIPTNIAGSELEKAWQSVLIDRARLIRGYNPEGPKPPLQTLFCGQPPSEIHSRLKARYERSGFHLDEQVHEPFDQLGVELLYTAALYRRAAELTEAGEGKSAQEFCQEAEDFINCEFGPFVWAYSYEMEARALTPFFKSFARCLREMLPKNNASTQEKTAKD
ncbi:hypothetical protein EGYY_01880 [Eggerthella sp. YY7918]|nr:hypothetical protein EGYY_01880 [Eggerthella sp. YY7918]